MPPCPNGQTRNKTTKKCRDKAKPGRKATRKVNSKTTLLQPNTILTVLLKEKGGECEPSGVTTRLYFSSKDALKKNFGVATENYTALWDAVAISTFKTVAILADHLAKKAPVLVNLTNDFSVSCGFASLR